MSRNPQWQNAFNQNQRQMMDYMFNSIMTGDPNNIEQMLRNFVPGEAAGSKRINDPLSTGRGEYNDILRQIASDYVNLGGVSPETRQAIDAMQAPEGFRHNAAERLSGARAMQGMFQQLAQALPQVTQAPAGVNVRMMGVPQGMSPSEYMAYFATNQALGSLDPVSKLETQQWLARSNPMLFRAYGMQPTPANAPAPVAQAPTAAQLNQIASNFDWNTIRSQLPTAVNNAFGQNAEGVGSSLDWMRRYLQTAAQGMGGTRAQQQLASGQLETLRREAQGNRDLGQYATLAENLVNPVMNQGSLSNQLGQNRALNSPSGTFRRRGGSLRNPGLV